ncbi:MAG: ribonuclease HII [Oscillospiraceae bacterium]|nr:ribonuclease HII [Oscillospiraceae bacterium]MBR4691321.1 ribonuclease HII [Oscillospiraceae bacterium]
MLAPDRELGLVCGLDEAGRGPLAGPVCAAAVILPEGWEPEGLNDSKKLSPQKREALYGEITAGALAWSVAFASEKEIDEVNILQATFLAMRRALEGLSVKPDFALVDGNRDPGLGLPTRCEVKGDGRYACIAAASVLAKVSRDRLMDEYDGVYPQYGFLRHKGYPTKAHYEALAEFGPCPIHRRSFLKKVLLP